MIPIAVFASGRGSNFDAIAAAIQEKKLDAQIVATISDTPEAAVLKKSEALGIPTLLIPFPNSQEGELSLEARRQRHEENILNALKPMAPSFLVMAGYRRILTSTLIEAFRSEKGYSKIVNIHPSLLPSFPGLNSYAQAFRYGVLKSGVTVHLVENEVDRGPICAQVAFSIEECRSEKEVEEIGLSLEHSLFPKTLNWVLPEKFRVERRLGGRVCVCKD